MIQRSYSFLYLFNSAKDLPGINLTPGPNILFNCPKKIKNKIRQQ